jgi:hypothetical protein
MGEAGVSKRIGSLAALVLLVLASCASPRYDTTTPPAQPTQPSHPVAHNPQPPRSVAPPAPPADQCGAQDLQWLVGKPRTEIPIPAEISNRRVMCTTCPRTEEFIGRRLNIEYDQDSGLVKSVQCG